MGVGEREHRAAIACLRAIGDAAATRRDGLPIGTALCNDDFDQVYELNLVRVEGPQPRLTAETLVEAADDALGGFAHRRAFVEDAATGARLAPGLRARGWDASELVLMAHDPERPRPPLRTRAEEVAELARRGAAEVFYRADAEVGRHGEAALRQLVLRETALPPAMRRNVAAFDDGRIASYCDMRMADGAAQVEHVTTLRGHEGRGLASAVVVHAVDVARAAGCEVVFLLALEDDWPRLLYEKLGFRTVGRAWDMVRKPGVVSSAG